MVDVVDVADLMGETEKVVDRREDVLADDVLRAKLRHTETAESFDFFFIVARFLHDLKKDGELYLFARVGVGDVVSEHVLGEDGVYG